MKLAILNLSQIAENPSVDTIKKCAANFPARQPIEIYPFGVCTKLEIADLQYDAYVAVGGDGDPRESEGYAWEKNFFGLTNNILQYNRRHPQTSKHMLFIGYSFMAYCRYYGFAQVTRRKSEAWCITIMQKTNAGATEKILNGLSEQFYAFDARAYQLLKPDKTKFQAGGAEIICLEKERPLISLERSIMGIRFSPRIYGVQFHGEANPDQLARQILTDEQEIIARYGQKKLDKMRDMLDNGVLARTFDNFIPNFLASVEQALPDAV